MASYEQDPTEPTGIRDLTPRGNSEVTRARDRKALSALDLKTAGWEWSAIADSLGYPSSKHAQIAVEQALEKDIFTANTQVMLRNLVTKRLERLQAAVWKKAIDPDHPDQMIAQQRVLAIIERFSRLHGLDAPTQHVVTSPSAQQLEAWVAQVAQAGQPALEEPDIFELEPSEYTVEF